MPDLQAAHGDLSAEHFDLLLRRDKLYFGPLDFDSAVPDENIRIPTPTDMSPWVLAGLSYTFEEASDATGGFRGFIELGYESETEPYDRNGLLLGLGSVKPGHLPDASVAVLGHQVNINAHQFKGVQALAVKNRLDWPGMPIIPKGATLVLYKRSHGGTFTQGIINGHIWGWEVSTYEY